MSEKCLQCYRLPKSGSDYCGYHGDNRERRYGRRRAEKLACAGISTEDLEAGVVRELVLNARKVMQLLEKYGPSIVPHLMDTDDNAGESLRQSLAKFSEVK